MKFIISLLFLLTLFGNAYAASSKEDYELQERCGKRAEERFKSAYGNGISKYEENTIMSDYTNHYNTKLNKCFVLTTSTIIPKKEKESGSYSKDLWDINENKNYGSFSKFIVGDKLTSCRVLNKFCASEAEWDALIKPYIEE
jgi:hypothetical protein